MKLEEKKGTVLLCILDGVGIGPKNNSNAIHVANTPTLDMLISNHPNSQLRSDGEYVGVPRGQMGNSEIGHITIGSGRVIQQSLVKISSEINNNELQNRPSYSQFINESQKSNAIHLIGLLSDGGIHSHIEHALGLCKLLNQLNKPILVHAITDGRDTAIHAGIEQLRYFQNQISELRNVEIVSVIGRYYAMDRDNRWDRTEMAWDLYTKGIGEKFNSPMEALQSSYDKGLSDEHIKPCTINVNNDFDNTINNQDAVFLFNFRGDRMRQITRCFLGFNDVGFNYKKLELKTTAIMSMYDSQFKNKCHIIYPPETCENTLGEVVSAAGMKQLRIAETEKYAHVTFFFNNGREEPFKYESRELIPSPRDVATYDLKPEMSLPILTSKLAKTIKSNEFDLIVLNIANADMVGHSGNFNAAIKAVEYIDSSLKQITSAIDIVNGQLLIIADHGNIEQMSINGKPSTTHTVNPVPCIYYGNKDVKLNNGSLADVAPTILNMLELKTPSEMTGKSLFKK